MELKHTGKTDSFTAVLTASESFTFRSVAIKDMVKRAELGELVDGEAEMNLATLSTDKSNEVEMPLPFARMIADKLMKFSDDTKDDAIDIRRTISPDYRNTYFPERIRLGKSARDLAKILLIEVETMELTTDLADAPVIEESDKNVRPRRSTETAEIAVISREQGLQLPSEQSSTGQDV